MPCSNWRSVVWFCFRPRFYANERCLQQWAGGINSGAARCHCFARRHCLPLFLVSYKTLAPSTTQISREQPHSSPPPASPRVRVHWSTRRPRRCHRRPLRRLDTRQQHSRCTRAAQPPLAATMIRGVPQLQKLVVRYCPHGGSSRGARAFVFEEFAKFAEANPAVECRSELGRGKHPVVRGSYVWGDDKVLDCKNRSSADVLKMAEVLRNSSGRKMLRFEKPVVSEKPSIQGPALGGARAARRSSKYCLPDDGPSRVSYLRAGCLCPQGPGRHRIS